MNEWKEFLIEDLAEFCNAKRVPLSSMQRQQLQGSYPYYGASGIVDYVNDYIFEGSHVLISEDGENLKSRNTPIAFEASGKFWVNNHAHILKAKEQHLTKILIHYFAQLDLSPYLTGAVQPKLNKATLSKIPLYLPSSIAEQKAIASVLSSLDDKIDLLHRQNKTLEAMAETLFRQWFIEDTAGKTELITLGEMIEIHDSKRIPLSKLERDKKKNGSIMYPYYGAAKIMDYVDDYIFDGDYLLLGEDGTVQDENGYPILQRANGKFWVNNHAHVLSAKAPYNNFFLWCLLSKTNIEKAVTGAVQPKINQENLRKLDFVKFDESKVLDFNDITSSMLNKLNTNNLQIQTLENLRDTLLPKLMSGEVRVQYQTEEVA
jgi:type I restriction enzyme S subunit